ncbi:type I polyketide synthase [Mycobacterium decipiens]|uniref:Polyketide synthase n=1 Tax=Mycobacterium decipiens TaxID=1430326 RepID=A0A1X2LNR6_9MYCO|nr:type I polyketide synthase [Mycobacterium decipiens]OSC36235.1 polyketide synthase [Mycobacterium decipiens]
MASQQELHSYLRQAVLELEKTRRRLRDVEARLHEPIAIVGMACRYPGGLNSPGDLWCAVSAGRDLVSGLPRDRGWVVDNLNCVDSHTNGMLGAWAGGFITDVTGFDADFFGISSDEVLMMDPHQRIALESAWEAFERAGIDPLSVRGSATGVFLGMTAVAGSPMNDGVAGDVQAGIRPFAATGQAPSMAAGRISYFLGLGGPAITLDTACSSSLVAIHQAVGALRLAECSLALAGGVTVMSTPSDFFRRLGEAGSAPDGRCKSFAATADGVGWGEGVGVVLLERLSDARENQHPVLAVVRGSAVNHDGVSNGPQAPNRLAQQRVIRRALANAGLDPADVDVVEAHGMGTPLGDLIEAEALMATYGRHRPAGKRLWLGSLKSNIGHTVAAAGVGGVIKMVEAMRHEAIPPTLHAEEPTPYVDWASGGVELATSVQPWPQNDGVRRVGVSAFGSSGVNAHVILEEASEDHPFGGTGDTTCLPDETSFPVVSWVITAKSAEALRMQGARLALHLQHAAEFRLVDIAFSLASSRAEFEHRAVIVGCDRDELLNGLQLMAAGRTSSGVVRGTARVSAKTAAFFPGEGAQAVATAKRLYASFPAYADAFDEVCSNFDERIATPLRDVVFAEPNTEIAALLDQSAYCQPASFVVEVALFRLAESWGFRPDVVVGHSLGEIAAAYVAGLWSLADACMLVAERGRLMQSVPTGRGVPSFEASEDEVVPYLDDFDGRSVVARNEAKRIQSEQMCSRQASHSSRLSQTFGELSEVCQQLSYRDPKIGVLSGRTGETVEAGLLSSPAYWVDLLRRPVRQIDAVHFSRFQGDIRSILEIGLGGELVTATRHHLTGEDRGFNEVTVAPLLRTGIEEGTSFLSGLASVYVRGTPIDWASGYAGSGARRVDLPTYPFQRRRFWLDRAASGNVWPAGRGGAQVSTSTAHVSQSRDPARTDTERTLAAAIEHVLGCGRIGRDDKFVALGGDSISAMRLAARVRAAGLPLTPQMVFEHSTLGQLAAALDHLIDNAESDGHGKNVGVVDDAQCQAMSMSGLSPEQLAALPGILAKP